jgi:hypothetical protein
MDGADGWASKGWVMGEEMGKGWARGSKYYLLQYIYLLSNVFYIVNK